jgi:catechol 2,3-dioxygenase-like lactoylglutathione lyase family enzyme
MTDHATPNLPSREFDATSRFYAALGFTESWRDPGWMILRRGTIQLEFFAFPDLDPARSSFSCCLRLDNLDAFYADCKAAGIAETDTGWPRLRPPGLEGWGGRVGHVVDPDGTLLRIIENSPSAKAI